MTNSVINRQNQPKQLMRQKYFWQILNYIALKMRDIQFVISDEPQSDWSLAWESGQRSRLKQANERGGPAQLDRNPVFLSDISAGF